MAWAGDISGWFIDLFYEGGIADGSLAVAVAFFFAQAQLAVQVHLPFLSQRQLSLPHVEHFIVILL